MINLDSPLVAFMIDDRRLYARRSLSSPAAYEQIKIVISSRLCCVAQAIERFGVLDSAFERLGVVKLSRSFLHHVLHRPCRDILFVCFCRLAKLRLLPVCRGFRALKFPVFALYVAGLVTTVTKALPLIVCYFPDQHSLEEAARLEVLDQSKEHQFIGFRVLAGENWRGPEHGFHLSQYAEVDTVFVRRNHWQIPSILSGIFATPERRSRDFDLPKARGG
jgi:hypothetical protein